MAGVAADIVTARKAGLEEEHLAKLDLLLRQLLVIDRDRAFRNGLEQRQGKLAKFLIIYFRKSRCGQHQ